MTRSRPAEMAAAASPEPAAGSASPSPPAAAVVRRPGTTELDPQRWLRRQRWLMRLLAIATPVLLLAAWEVSARVGVVDARFFGSPWGVAQEAVRLVEEGQLQEHLLASVGRVLGGYALGSAVGLAVGLLLGYSRILRAMFEPLLSALYVVPKLAILPILLLLFGLGELPKVLAIAIAVFFIVCLSSISAALLTPRGMVEVAESFAASRLRIFWQVVIPHSLPPVFSALRLASGIAVLMLVAVEFVNARDGLGYLIWHSWTLFLASQMYVGIVTVALFGVVFSFTVKWIGHRLAPWAPHGDIRDELG